MRFKMRLTHLGLEAFIYDLNPRTRFIYIDLITQKTKLFLNLEYNKWDDLQDRDE